MEDETRNMIEDAKAIDCGLAKNKYRIRLAGALHRNIRYINATSLQEARKIAKRKYGIIRHVSLVNPDKLRKHQ